MRNPQPSGYALVAVLGLTIFSGVLHGRVSSRWGAAGTVLSAAGSLERLPERIGQWESVLDQELDAASLDMLKPAAYRSTVYRNGATGRTVHVFLILGPTGPLSVHKAEICMSAEYELVDEPSPVAIDAATADPRHVFMQSTFCSKRVDSELVRVYYAWSTGEKWNASENARITFLGVPYLYKAQIHCEILPGSEYSGRDPGRDFLEAFVPVAEETLAPLK